jgi:hypothetical protein
MQLFIVLLRPLILDIPADHLFTAMPSDRADKIPFGPTLTSPQLLFDCGDTLKQLSGGQTFDNLYNLRWTVAGNGLDEEMLVILVGPYLQKDDLIPLSNFQTDLFEHPIYLGVEPHSTVLGRTHNVIDQDRNIMALMQILAHTSDSITLG